MKNFLENFGIGEAGYVADLWSLIQHEAYTGEPVLNNTSHRENLMIEATKPIGCDCQNWQLHRSDQIADEIIAVNRRHPIACPFHNHVFNPIPKRIKCAENVVDINTHLLDQAANERHCRHF